MLNSPIIGGIAGGMLILGFVYLFFSKTLSDVGKELKVKVHEEIEKTPPK